MTITFALLFGILIGVVLGLLGAGGSILAVPALVYAAGLEPREAIPVSLVVVGVASAAAAIPKVRAGHVQWRLAGIFAAAGVPATFAGALIGSRIPQPALMIGFAAVMVIAGIRMLAKPESTGTSCEARDGRVDWRRCASRSVPAGLAAGLLTGLFGVGGGFLIIPALVVFLGVEMPIAVGTSLLVIVANSATGILSEPQGLSAHWPVAVAFALTATATSLLASRIGTRVDTERLQRWFAFVLIAVAVFVAVDTIWIR